jgi:hypothetical protein
MAVPHDKMKKLGKVAKKAVGGDIAVRIVTEEHGFETI